MTRLLILAAAAVAGTGAPMRRAAERPFIAFRYDADRVVIYTAEDPRLPPARAGTAARSPSGTDAACVAARGVAGPHIAELPAPHDAVDRPGARWTIHAAPGIAVTATAERSVFGGGGCFGSYGVIARVDDEWRDGFRAVRFNYHAARRGAVPAWSPGSTLGAIDAFPAADRARLEAVVRRELDRAIREVVEATAPDYRRAQETHRAWAVAWRAADAALLRGAGSLDLDALTYVITPDGDPRLYVRTRVQVGGRSAFAMWFWIRDRGGEMTVEHRSAEPAKHMRIREYGGPFDLPPSRVGDVLGILDADGDGWAEILVTAHGYEGHSITAYEYSPQALEPTGAGFHWGC